VQNYTLGAHYLYIRTNVRKVWGARYTSVRVIYRKIRNIVTAYCLFLTELEGMSPDQWEGIDEILDRTKKRIVRQRTISSFRSLKKNDSSSGTTNSDQSEKVQPGDDANHGRSSAPPRHSSLRERTLQNIAESDDVFSDENLTESLV
jgi:hypothetical protein